MKRKLVLSSLVLLAFAATVGAQTPTVTPANIHTSGNSLPGTFTLGDQVVVRWDNSPTGDNNPSVALVRVNFFGILTINASDDGSGCDLTASDNIWTACYTLQACDLSAEAVAAAVTVWTPNAETSGEVADDTTFDVQTCPVPINLISWGAVKVHYQ